MASQNDLPQYGNFIDGQERPPAGGEYFPTENPYSGQAWALIARSDGRDVEQAVESARQAFESQAWSSLTATQRGTLLRKLADLVIAHTPRLAEIEMRHNGTLEAEATSQSRTIGDNN